MDEKTMEGLRERILEEKRKYEILREKYERDDLTEEEKNEMMEELKLMGIKLVAIGNELFSTTLGLDFSENTRNDN